MTITAPPASGLDAPPPRPTRRPRAVRSAVRRVTGVTAPYGFVAPFFMIFFVFGLFPMAYTFWVSLTDRDLLRPNDAKMIGLRNYTDLLHDEFFWNAVKNTFELMLLCTVPQLALALILAHILNARLRGRMLFRMGVLLPNITSIVAVTIVFGQLFSRDFGLFNWLLGLVGIDNVNWQAGEWSSKIAIAMMVVWRWTGYNALIYLAAMQAIPKEQFEAAAIDGAGTWRQLWHVTLPALRPTIAFTALVSLIGQIQLFTEPLLFDISPGSVSGGTDRQFQTLALFLYEEGFRLRHFGYGSAVAWLMFLLTVILAAFAYFLTRGGARIRGSSLIGGASRGGPGTRRLGHRGPRRPSSGGSAGRATGQAAARPAGQAAGRPAEAAASPAPAPAPASANDDSTPGGSS
ncbi:sugar ABC transporter permease [Pseudofrankia sp. BMG5.37]|uniref:carbohydrate ABC transporter permease n=1 Tax=Pseudofrankia sp. BMG5.36 TaxID=1834512 RepID=UPI0009F6506F|nr:MULTISPECIES: sugar ABC transporter permease [unclassified Pseudofrankia]MDT3439802.1 sugar ABC transporter permease [Pseudofrankia sp. BMG5.37]